MREGPGGDHGPAAGPTDSRAAFTGEGLARALEARAPDLAQVSPRDTAGVLFLLQDLGDGSEPILLLNKRSARVKQPGDLCCPGGRVHRGIDGALGRLLAIPGSPLLRSPGWSLGARRGGLWKRSVRLFWACCLRESWEEMGLRPWGVQFLGVLPPYELQLFRRGMLPLVGWLRGERRFHLNWEVARVVPVALSDLLDPSRYGVYLLEAAWRETPPWGDGPVPFPCFLHRGETGSEVLWGATYQIVLTFLDRVCGFAPPPVSTLPVVTGTLPETYVTGDRPGR